MQRSSQLQLSRIANSAGVECHRHFGAILAPTSPARSSEHRSHAKLIQRRGKHRFPRGAGHRPEHLRISALKSQEIEAASTSCEG